jgi:translation initiation factor IF-2
MSKVRIYELARELKLESKKVLEDARRLGVDVSVPSNTLDEPIAEKIREMYYPKKEPVAQPRTARLVKAARPSVSETALSAPDEAPAAATPASAPPATQPSISVSEAPKPRVVKLAPPAPTVAAPPAPEAKPVEVAAPAPEVTAAPPPPAESEAAAPTVEAPPAPEQEPPPKTFALKPLQPPPPAAPASAAPP